MRKAPDSLLGLRIAEPCHAAWQDMAGDERVRYCTLCSLNVYNFAEMTHDEVRDLLARTEGRVCARLYRRADGTVLTRDCPTGLRALRQRLSRVAAASMAAILSLASLACGTRPRVKTQGSPIKLAIERAVAPQPAVFSGVVRDESGNPIPGVTVTVRDENSCELNVITDANGAFSVPSLSDGSYGVEVMLDGFEHATVTDLSLKRSEVALANVTLLSESITVGVLVSVVDSTPTIDGLSTTFPQEFINKMPF